VSFARPKEQIRNQSTQTLEDLRIIEKDGYIILRNILSENEIQQLKSAISPFLTYTGRNRFEGVRTHRVYALLAKSRVFDDLILHPRVIPLVDQLLLPNYLLTAYQGIDILPGEKPQPMHHDDQFISVRRPHRAFGVSTIWALDEFTSENGATIVYPGSHLWGHHDPPEGAKVVKCVMPAGSVVIFLSTLWHGGGPNISKNSRLALSAQYCEPWIRQQENQILNVPFSVVNTLHPKLKALIGYSVHPPFIGHANGLHPLKKVEEILEGREQGWGAKL